MHDETGTTPPNQRRWSAGGMEYLSTGGPWQPRFGYCRALRAGPFVFMGGVVAVTEDGSVYAPGDAGAQTTRCYEIITDTIARFGLGPGSIVRTRGFALDMADAEAIGGAHKAFFDEAVGDRDGGPHHPCLTLVGGAQLIGDGMRIEIEVDLVDLSAVAR